jgi:transcriptional regulator with XRE-family HTH domain
VKIRGERIEDLRIRLGWTQDRLAEETGVSRDTISKLESGARKPPHGITVGKITRAPGSTRWPWRTCPPPIFVSPTSRARRPLLPSSRRTRRPNEKAFRMRAMP